MAVGTIEKRVLTDIANAIRQQAGHDRGILPKDMASAVAALDGHRQGAAGVREAESGKGVLPASVFQQIADAIRAQSGFTKPYTPLQMPDAILELSWIVKPTLVALLTSEGVLEFAYRDRVQSAWGTVLKWWEVDPGGYAKAADRPWDDAKTAAVRCVIDASVADAGVVSCAWWLHGCSNLVEVTGLEALRAAESMDGMFTSCAALESAFSTCELSPASAKQIFYGCNRLVGAQGYVPKSTDGASALGFGDSGALTDPSGDEREWFVCRLYSDGLLVLGDQGGTGEILAEGRLCAQARYASSTAAPWSKRAASVKRARIESSMGSLSFVNMDYWFYGCTAMTALEGASFLPEVHEMRHAFNRCSSLAALDLKGLSPAGITSVFSTFASCSALKTITVDPSWALPSGVADIGCFTGCKSLVGGAGTAWSSSKTSGLYMRIDRAGAPGYLTAG